jgi:hypothetical protein
MLPALLTVFVYMLMLHYVSKRDVSFGIGLCLDTPVLYCSPDTDYPELLDVLHHVMLCIFTYYCSML